MATRRKKKPLTHKQVAKRHSLALHSVHFGMFDFEIIFAVGPGKEIGDYVRWHMDDPTFDWEYSGQLGMHFHRRGKCPVVWLPRAPETAKEYGALAHELIHAVRHMFQDWAGMPHTADTDEAYAYAISHAMTTLLTKVAA
ncbi:hypothetical protein [Pseudolabrys sp.]|uniref:hypothetical protein n=1 Tax=Pseudolabrys sp. TaxID=1960880 RepID=UPI003D0FD635